jgi:hypothetical protein
MSPNNIFLIIFVLQVGQRIEIWGDVDWLLAPQCELCAVGLLTRRPVRFPVTF